MTDEGYTGWVEGHCRATAAGADAAEALLSEPARRYFEEHGATAGELGECTYRLIPRPPKFANEHAEAVARELRALREERAAAARPDPKAMRAGYPACRWCQDTGLVTVPHWRCVEIPADGPPRLVAYQHDGVRYSSVVEVSVVCDEFDCTAGARVGSQQAQDKKPRPRWSKYRARFHGVDVVALLEQHNRAFAAMCRAKAAPDNGTFEALFGQVRKRVAQVQGEAA